MTLMLKEVSLSLRDEVLVKPFSLDVAAGSVVTLMGPSGCGKSSLLSFVGGDVLDAFKTSGDVVLNGQSLIHLPPEKRRVARLFQDDFLFPHMTVGENLLFAVPAMARAERLGMVATALQRLELSGFADRAPHTLSGGQRQRIALMRALLSKPAAILLDEPFSKLDAGLRQQMRDYVFAHLKERGIPTLLVTHERDDAPPNGVVYMIADREVRRV
jgi:putative thiamine transport system ATP-binding protein